MQICIFSNILENPRCTPLQFISQITPVHEYYNRVNRSPLYFKFRKINFFLSHTYSRCISLFNLSRELHEYFKSSCLFYASNFRKINSPF